MSDDDCDFDYADGAYRVARRHLTRLENNIFKLAEDFAKERTPTGKILVTSEDVRRAIQELNKRGELRTAANTEATDG
jgi:hypothetical protein